MKKIVSFMVLLSNCHSPLNAAGSGAQLSAARDLQSAVASYYFESKTGIPSSWDDLTLIRLLKEGSLEQNPYRMEAFNSFAIVPGAPVIAPENNIPADLLGTRLFAIGRHDFTNGDAGTGRIGIFITPPEAADGETQVYSHFVPHATVLAIFGQIAGFDPMEEPLPFPNAVQLERERNYRHQRLADDVKRHTSFAHRWSFKGFFAGGRGDWFAGGLAVLVLFAWLALRMWRR